MFLLLLSGCPVPLVVVGEGGADSGEVDSGDTAPLPGADLSHYAGHRRFVADEGWFECDETETDAGTELTEGSLHDHLRDLCPVCDRFYENEPKPTSLCDGYLMIGTAWRAVDFRDDGSAGAYFILGYDEYYSISTADTSARWDGRSLSFAYTLDLGGVAYSTTGTMEFEAEGT